MGKLIIIGAWENQREESSSASSKVLRLQNHEPSNVQCENTLAQSYPSRLETSQAAKETCTYYHKSPTE